MTVPEITTFTELSDLYQKRDGEIVDHYRKSSYFGYGGIEINLSMAADRLANTMDCLLVALKLLKKQDAN